MGKMRIIIADNGEIFREGLAKLLENRPDIEVLATCSTGKETIQKAIELRPDIILLDKYISQGSFTEVSQHIRRELPKTHIIITQPYKDADPLSPFEVNASGYIDKDIPVEMLLRPVFEQILLGEAFLSHSIAARVLKEFSAQKKDSVIGQEEPVLKTDLTERELEVLALVAQKGMTNKEIANTLSITEGTVKGHLSRILEKLHVRNRQQAALLAREKGIVQKTVSRHASRL